MELRTAVSIAVLAPPAQAHVRDGRLPGLVVAGDPVDPGDDLRGRPAAAAVEDAHRDEAHALRNAVGRAADGAGHVRAVSVAIGSRSAGRDRVVAGHRAPAELGVGVPDAGVDDVRRHPCAGVRVVERPVRRPLALVDSIEAPRRSALGRVGDEDRVGFHGGDARVARQRLSRGVRERDRESAQRVRVDEGDVASVATGRLGRNCGSRSRRAPQHDDVIETPGASQSTQVP